MPLVVNSFVSRLKSINSGAALRAVIVGAIVATVLYLSLGMQPQILGLVTGIALLSTYLLFKTGAAKVFWPN